MYYRLLLSLLTVTCMAHQPFEPLFLHDGIIPLERHAQFSSVLVIHSAEQFVERVIKSEEDSIVCVVEHGSPESARFLSDVVSVAQVLQQPCSLICIYGNIDVNLAASVGSTLGVAAWHPPCGVVFVKGHAVLPVIESVSVTEEEIFQRFAFAAGQKCLPWWQRFLCFFQAVGTWLSALWAKISDYLFRQ